MDLSANTLVTILAAIGLLALIVNIVTDVIKDVAIFKKIPTDIIIIVLSQAITLYAYFAYISYSLSVIIWYYVVATVIAGFIVAYVVMYGWDKLVEAYKKFRNIPSVDITTEPLSSDTLITSKVSTDNSEENSFISSDEGMTSANTTDINSTVALSLTSEASQEDLDTFSTLLISSSNTHSNDAELVPSTSDSMISE